MVAVVDRGRSNPSRDVKCRRNDSEEAVTDTNESIDSTTLMNLTARIVSAYAEKATLSLAELNETIAAVANALRDAGGREVTPRNPDQTPAVPIKKSVTPEFLVCLEDGKKLKMLKRHLKTAYDMTPADYRAKWRLPHDYPMTAPGYAAVRSRLAKTNGLGKNPPARAAVTKAASPAMPKRGRPRKVAPSSKAS